MSCNFPLILGLYIENNGTMKDLGIIMNWERRATAIKLEKT